MSATQSKEQLSVIVFMLLICSSALMNVSQLLDSQNFKLDPD